MWLDSFLRIQAFVFYSRAKTRKRRKKSTCHESQSGWKDLSLFQSSRHTVRSCCRSLWILKVLTLSHQLQGSDVIGLSKSRGILTMQSKSEQSKRIPAQLWRPHFFVFCQRTVSVSARHECISIHVCVRLSVHVHACARAVINTPFLMSDKRMKNGMVSREKGRLPHQ